MKIFKKAIIVSLAIVISISAAVTPVSAASTTILGTNKALGSPVLNSEFTTESWNRWEMLCWGVFLSNFCSPIIDDYGSAFNTEATYGSRGNGMKALQFSSGSDENNNEVVKSLVMYAVSQQQEGAMEKVYVGYSDIDASGIVNDTRKNIADINPESTAAPTEPEVDETVVVDTSTTEDETTVEEAEQVIMGQLSQATLRDLFPEARGITGTASELAWLKKINFGGLLASQNPNVGIAGYSDIVTVEEGSLPTFYVEYSGGFEILYDYCNGWDMQVMQAWIARAFTGENREESVEVFNDIWANADKQPLYMDCFGNIITIYKNTRRVVIPASCNIHLSDTPTINLVNSLFMNGSFGNTSEAVIKMYGRQLTEGIFGSRTSKSSIVRQSGTPAFADSVKGMEPGTVLFYFDTDTIIYKALLNKMLTGTKPAGNGLSAFANIASSTLMPMNGTASKTLTESVDFQVDIGSVYATLFDCNIFEETTDSIIPKLESVNFGSANLSGLDKDFSSRLEMMYEIGGCIANIANEDLNAKVITNISELSGTKQKLFTSEPIAVPVQIDPGYGFDNTKKFTSAAVSRAFIDMVYEGYKKGFRSSTGIVLPENIKSILMTSKTEEELRKKLFLADPSANKGTPSVLLKSFISTHGDFFGNVDTKALDKVEVNSDKAFTSLAESSLNSNTASGAYVTKYRLKDGTLGSANEYGSYYPGRVALVYNVSGAMQRAGEVLGVREGAEFGTWSAHIYLTYLDVFNIQPPTALNNKEKHSFNTRIFDGTEDILNIDITKIADLASSDYKKASIQEYTYLMLHPTKGRGYRTQMMRDSVSDFIYDTYQKIVYGKATDYYSSGYSGIASRNSSGFLNIDSYEDNFMTGWLMDVYPDVAVVLIGVGLVVIMVMGMFKKKKLSWFFISFFLVINAILITPAMGEILPYVTNKVVQNMFSNNMTYWAMAESVYNLNMESSSLKEEADGLSNLTEEERQQVSSIVKSMNSIYLDRSLSLKTDISRKVTQTQTGNLSEIQKLRSTRWLLPIMMRQFTATDNSADYVYIPLGDMYDDVGNLYLRFVGEEAASGETLNSSTFHTIYNEDQTVNDEFLDIAFNTSVIYPDYVSNLGEVDPNGDPHAYLSEAYTGLKDRKDLPHTYFYLLNKMDLVPSRKSAINSDEEDVFEEYYNSNVGGEYGLMASETAWLDAASLIESEAGLYDRFDPSSVRPEYGYLWATETVYPYMYLSVKDCYDARTNIGQLTGYLTGSYVELENSKEVRKSFMHSQNTGYIKDILDLEHLFTNTIPYLYEMTLVAGGYDGETGVFGDSNVENYTLYEDNNRSWMFRSNWATKISESPELSKKTVVYDKNGQSFDVKNGVLPDCYPASRPMVFSEAQMNLQGLTEDQLSLAELKCISVNKEVSRRWTLMLNYVNMEGANSELILRQMATEAVLAFNSEFSPSGIFSGSFTLYPTSLDLRAISFDSIMKMLMLNVTKDASYIYGDTMLTVIENSDVFTAVLMLLSAFLCAYIIPLLRTVVMGLVFYLGVASVIGAIFTNSKSKLKVSCGFLVSNILLLGITLAFYMVFAIMMAVVSDDNVLTVQTIQVNTGSPVWSIILIIVAGIAYIYGLYKLMVFCFRHYRDMGYSVYSAVIGDAVSGLGAKISSFGQKIQEKVAGDGGSADGGTRGTSGGVNGSGSGSRSGRDDIQKVEVTSGNIDATMDGFRQETNGEDTGYEYETNAYGRREVDRAHSDNSSRYASEIDRDIEEGKRSLERDRDNDMFM